VDKVVMSKPIKKRIMKKIIKRFLKYIRNPSNEFGFLVLAILKKWSNLPANICIDVNGSWINQGNKKIILFQTTVYTLILILFYH
jgi:hypothetical protein